ncbi:MAG: nitrous oxide reductase accessory protein NosL [Anaerolineae bacterium]
MTRLWRVWSAAIVFMLVVSACAATSGEPQPPDIAYGRDMCDACGMIISEARFAAATLTEQGKTLKFDDAGEMFSYHTAHPEDAVKAWFVHDYDSQRWIRGETAFFVVSPSLQTPMGTGLAVFADRAAADAFATRTNAKVMSLAEAQTMLAQMKMPKH